MADFSYKYQGSLGSYLESGNSDDLKAMFEDIIEPADSITINDLAKRLDQGGSFAPPSDSWKVVAQIVHMKRPLPKDYGKEYKFGARVRKLDANSRILLLRLLFFWLFLIYIQ